MLRWPISRSGWLRSPTLGKVLSLLEIAMGVCCLSISVYLLYLTRTPEITREAEAADTIRGLYIGAGVVVAPGILFTVGGLAMLCRRKWGWWLGLLVCIATVALCGYSAWDERHHPDFDDLWVLAGFVVATIFFFLPGVRNYLVTKESNSMEIS
jgi:hypothetical protein